MKDAGLGRFVGRGSRADPSFLTVAHRHPGCFSLSACCAQVSFPRGRADATGHDCVCLL